MYGSAPYTSRTGSQSVLVMNPGPKRAMVMAEARVICIAIAARVTTAPAAKAAVTHRNDRSPRFTSAAGRGAPSSGCSAAAPIRLLASAHQHLAARGDGLQEGLLLGHQRGRQRRVEEGGAALLAV